MSKVTRRHWEKEVGSDFKTNSMATSDQICLRQDAGHRPKNMKLEASNRGQHRRKVAWHIRTPIGIWPDVKSSKPTLIWTLIRTWDELVNYNILQIC